jgi:predicted kinase
MSGSKFFIFSGLPGTGKSTLASRLASHLPAVYLRVDTIEQGLRELCNYKVEGEGYRLSYRLAKENLLLGNKVVADSVNPWTLSRNEWNSVATRIKVPFVDIEITCSDQSEHRKRVETREQTVPGLKMPTWKDVVDREYHAWDRSRIQIDTAGKSVEQSFIELLELLEINSH